MNLTMLHERLNQMQSEILRRNGRTTQLLSEAEEIRLRVPAFIGAPPTPVAQQKEGRLMLMVSEAPRVERSQDTFIRTFTGKKFWPLDPAPEEVDIEDIAHALSLVCRFTGHTYCFYSVADHSLRVSRLAEQLILKENRSRTPVVISTAREMALWGLLHDASEAYLCDLPSPLKRAPGLGQLYKGFELNLTEVIADRFELSPHEPSVVKDADRILLKTEMRDLMNATEGFSLDWDYANYSPLPETIFPLGTC